MVFVENQIRENPKNTGNIWKTIRSCIPKKSSDFRTYNKGDKVVANDFNALFTSVSSEVVNKINIFSSDCNYTPSHTSFLSRYYLLTEQFTLEPVKCSQFEEIVYSLSTNKAPGTDKIPVPVIKDCLP